MLNLPLVVDRHTTRQGELAHVQRNGAPEARAVHDEDGDEPAGALPLRDPAAPARARRRAVPPPRGARGPLGGFARRRRDAARVPARARVARLLPHAALVPRFLPERPPAQRHRRPALRFIADLAAPRLVFNIYIRSRSRPRPPPRRGRSSCPSVDRPPPPSRCRFKNIS